MYCRWRDPVRDAAQRALHEAFALLREAQTGIVTSGLQSTEPCEDRHPRSPSNRVREATVLAVHLRVRQSRCDYASQLDAVIGILTEM